MATRLLTCGIVAGPIFLTAWAVQTLTRPGSDPMQFAFLPAVAVRARGSVVAGRRVRLTERRPSRR